MRRQLVIVAAFAALIGSGAAASAQEPALIPGATDEVVLSDEVVTQEISHNAESAPEAPSPGQAATPRPVGRILPVPVGGYPYSGYWHAGYQHPMYGRPVALVVPPVSHYQTIYGWGIATTQMTPIYPQYAGPTDGPPWTEAGQYAYPPYWPWDTRQFGVYYIRGPW